MKPQKKVWTKPEIVDLDVNNTRSGNNNALFELLQPTYFSTSTFGPTS